MSLYFIILASISLISVILNMKFDIQMMQQNSYRNKRFFNWVKQNYADSFRLIYLALMFLLLSTLLDIRVSLLLSTITLIILSIYLLRKKYKKPLVFTNRVKRIYSVTAFLEILIIGIVSYLTLTFNHDIIDSYKLIYSIILLSGIISWSIVMCAIVLLTPIESSINKKYYNEAKNILSSMPDMKVIGITGSYGKTSTKHYLNRILSEHYDVIMTPGSYNTPMGVIRTIREMMKPYNQIFICEMGAKQKGDIKEICDLVNPYAGIITAVGPMHLETFKSIENVQSTKFELADAIKNDGFIVINNDFEFCANRVVSEIESIRYGVTNLKECKYHAKDIHYGINGATFILVDPDKNEIEFKTKLLGECNISNLIASIIMAIKLNVPIEKIKYAVESIDQVEHRLNVKRTPGGVTIIDDAFNSNPTGSKMAVEVLSHFKDGNRIIVTPGMIELGEMQYELNKELGKNIGKNVDIAIIVGEYNRKALVEGIFSTDFDKKNIYEVGSFSEAQEVLGNILKSGDVVLYENDLPDTFK